VFVVECGAVAGKQVLQRLFVGRGTLHWMMLGMYCRYDIRNCGDFLSLGIDGVRIGA
jgi:hypothetical protein